MGGREGRKQEEDKAIDHHRSRSFGGCKYDVHKMLRLLHRPAVTFMATPQPNQWGRPTCKCGWLVPNCIHMQCI